MKPLVLWGGVDINPKLYGEDMSIHTQTPNNGRDTIELHNIHEAFKDGTPIVGVCRGAQLLCVANGGSLYQHSIPSEQSHTICTLDKHTFNSVPADHHQLMKPKGNFIYYGWNPEYVKLYLQNDKTATMSNTPEIVYWPETRSLAIQPHPEWCNKHDPFVTWINKLMKNLNITYSF